MAVEQSVAQMALTRDTGPGGFMERAQASMVKVAATVLDEAPGAHYQQRTFYAQHVMQLPRQSTEQAGTAIVMGASIIAKTTYDEQTKSSICTATDSEMDAQILSLWNVLAGIPGKAPVSAA
jgi:hypothetical protein